MNKNLLSFSFALLISGSVCQGQSLASMFYCSVLGRQDVRSEYKELAVQALTHLGVQDPESVPVKQMNGVGPSFARVDLSSFTAFGIWFDEAYLDSCSREEQLFHIYHEAAHYASKHHQKTLAGSAVSLGLAAFVMIKLQKVLSQEPDFVRYGVLAASAFAAVAGFYLYLLPQVVKAQEKEADILAVKTLIQTGSGQIADNYIDQIKNAKNSIQNDTWWPSVHEQIQYLELARNESAIN